MEGFGKRANKTTESKNLKGKTDRTEAEEAQRQVQRTGPKAVQGRKMVLWTPLDAIAVAEQIVQG